MNTLTAATLPVDRAALDRCARQVDAAVKAVLEVQGFLHVGDSRSALEEARGADTAAQDAYLGLIALGAAVPVGSPAPQPIPLDQLATPEARNLLSILEEAQQAAERVDASRGRSLPPDTPLQPGESRGTDLAEAISVLCLRLRTEVYGPSGGGRE